MTEKTPEDEAFEALEAKLGKKQVEQAVLKLQDELEVYRNEVIEEIAAKLEAEFQIPFAQDTVASFAAWIREMKR